MLNIFTPSCVNCREYLNSSLSAVMLSDEMSLHVPVKCMHPSQRTHALDVGDDVIQAPCAALLEQPLKSLLGVLRQVVRCIMW